MKWELQQLHKLILPKSHSLQWHHFCMCQGPIMENRIGLTSGRQTSSWRRREWSLTYVLPICTVSSSKNKKKPHYVGKTDFQLASARYLTSFPPICTVSSSKNKKTTTSGRQTSSWRRREISLLFRRFAQFPRAKIKKPLRRVDGLPVGVGERSHFFSADLHSFLEQK